MNLKKSINKSKLIRRKHRKGITLIELVVVIFVIGTILGVIAMNMDIGQIKDSTAKLKLTKDKSNLPSFLEIYNSKYGSYPSEEQGLMALVEKPEAGDVPENYSPVVKGKSTVLDPWNTPYVLKFDENGNYMIITLGSDKKEGGEGKNADFNILDEDSYPEDFKK